MTATYSTKLVALKVLGFAATEATFIYQVRKILLHHFFNHLGGLVKPVLGRARDM